MARILVIDDEEQVRDMLAEMLESSGHEVVVAPDGDSAIEMHRSSRCDLVIADMFLPGRNGLDTIRALRALDPGVKILALSGGGGFRRFDVLARAPESGATTTMTKPVDMEELVMTVRDLTRAS